MTCIKYWRFNCKGPTIWHWQHGTFAFKNNWFNILSISTCVTLSTWLSPDLSFACGLGSVSMLWVAGWNLLVSWAHPWESLLTQVLKFKLWHICGWLGAKLTVRTTLSATLRFYLLLQREMMNASYTPSHSRLTHCQRQWLLRKKNVK